MLGYIVRRTLWALPVILVVSSVTFMLMHAIPGGPFSEEKVLPPEIVKNLEAKYHLDDPLWKQYIDYMWGFLKFDFGPSITYKARTVQEIIAQQWPVTIMLGLASFVIAVCLGIPLGLLSAIKQNTFIDYSSMWVSMLGLSIPNMALGPFLVWIFALNLRWFPVATWGGLSHIILPAITLGTAYMARFARFTRASMLEVLREEYIQTARAKGVRELLIMLKHAFRNALIPVTTITGPSFAAMIMGSLIVEQIFAIPGIGRYYVFSVTNRDYPCIMTITLLFAMAIIVMNLLVDISYAFIDPRIRHT